MQEREYNAGGPGADFGAGAFGYRRRISWGAIIAGTVAALSVQLLLTLLGLSIGMWAIDPAAGQETFQGIGIGAAIWAIATFVIALYVGGWIAGRMSGLGNRFDGFLEGFLVWGVVTVVTFMLLTTTVGSIVGGAAGLAGEIVATAGQSEEATQTAQEYGEPAREALEDPETQQEIEETAREAGEEVATAGAATSFFAFLSLLLGAAAAAFAGRQGSASGLREAGEPGKR